MIIIDSIYVTKQFRYLWLKKVTGIDLSQHCAKCLIGEYSRSISAQTKSESKIELSDGIYYLCGVAFPFNWENNFHLAFESSKGSSIEYSFGGISVTITNAAQLPISDVFIDYTLPQAKYKSYATCRNWQIANFLAQRKS